MNYEKVITILSKRPGPPSRKSPVYPNRFKRPLARRKQGGIRFWDLGYILDGAEYISLPFVDLHSLDPIQHDAEVFPTFAEYDALTTDYYDQIHELIFDEPTNEWKDKFKQITEVYTLEDSPTVRYKGTNYGMFDAPNWDGDKFRPNGAATDDSFSVGIDSRLFTGIAINMGADIKITTSPDYTAPDVAFVPSKTMDVFLVPTLLDVGFITNHNTVLPIGDNKFDFLDHLRYIYPREFFQDPSNDLYGVYFGSFFWDTAQSDAAYEAAYNAAKYWQDNRATRALRGEQVSFFPDVFTDIDVSEFGPPDAFPPPPDIPTQYIGNSLFGGSTATAPLAGSLLGVILKGGTYYYVWKD